MNALMHFLFDHKCGRRRGRRRGRLCTDLYHNLIVNIITRGYYIRLDNMLLFE